MDSTKGGGQEAAKERLLRREIELQVQSSGIHSRSWEAYWEQFANEAAGSEPVPGVPLQGDRTLLGVVRWLDGLFRAEVLLPVQVGITSGVAQPQGEVVRISVSVEELGQLGVKPNLVINLQKEVASPAGAPEARAMFMLVPVALDGVALQAGSGPRRGTS